MFHGSLITGKLLLHCFRSHVLSGAQAYMCTSHCCSFTFLDWRDRFDAKFLENSKKNALSTDDEYQMVRLAGLDGGMLKPGQDLWPNNGKDIPYDISPIYCKFNLIHSGAFTGWCTGLNFTESRS